MGHTRALGLLLLVLCRIEMLGSGFEAFGVTVLGNLRLRLLQIRIEGVAGLLLPPQSLKVIRDMQSPPRP